MLSINCSGSKLCNWEAIISIVPGSGGEVDFLYASELPAVFGPLISRRMLSLLGMSLYLPTLSDSPPHAGG